MRLLREVVTGPDCFAVMLGELRITRPEIFDADRWKSWELAVGQLIAAMPTSARRWDATRTIGADLVKALPTLELAEAYLYVLDLIFTAGGTVMEER